ncbi:MAG: rane protein [Thermomicrobiales bacterium]|nr:rane protein [Thermomicrobiales bacterium]
MVEALVLGMVAQSSLLLSGLLVYWVRIPTKVVGILAGFGAGALISAIAFDLIPEAELLGPWQLVLWMLLGAALLLAGDAIVERRFGDEGAGGAMGIVVGSAVSVGFLAAVLVSNVPQAIAPSADLANAGWSAGRTARLWLAVVASCGVAAALGWLGATAFPGANGDRAAALAAGGLLAMLTNSLMPFAYERGGELAGVATVIGFCLAIVAQ